MSLKIDYSINNWLKDLALDKNKDYLNKLLNLGYQVSNISNISINPESTILEPITQKVLDINTNCNNTYREMLHSLDLYKSNTEYLKEVVVSDSLPQNKKQDKCSKLKTFSIVPMLSEVINRLNKGGSLSEIFEI